MIDTQIIYLINLVTDTVNPPLVAFLFMSIPIIQRIVPFLACGAEIVRGNAGYGIRVALFVYLE